MDGFVNVDKYPLPQPQPGFTFIQHDLEQFPWPFANDSVDYFYMNHVLEHVGRDTDTFLRIFQEMYRVARPNAVLQVTVPHPRHDSYLTDPTHVRPITVGTLTMFSRFFTDNALRVNAANTPLANILGVDFDLITARIRADALW